jgi:DNA-directed RNA polymerase specialized sigma24 family protein
MSSTGSVTHWIDLLKGGDPAAVQQLWEAYFPRLVGLARKKLRESPRRAADEEDVALSAFDSFFDGAARGRFPRLADREDLWHVLVTITARKALQLLRHEQRQKRGGGAVRGESAFHDGAGAGSEEAGLEQVLGSEPTPEFAAQVAEEYQQLLARLGDADLCKVAVWKMEGYSNKEIAGRLVCVPRTVERKLRLIRTLWGQEEPTAPGAS